MAHYKANGPCRRESKRGGRKNNGRALTYADTSNIHRFVIPNYQSIKSLFDVI